MVFLWFYGGAMGITGYTIDFFSERMRQVDESNNLLLEEREAFLCFWCFWGIIYPSGND